MYTNLPRQNMSQDNKLFRIQTEITQKARSKGKISHHFLIQIKKAPPTQESLCEKTFLFSTQMLCPKLDVYF